MPDFNDSSTPEQPSVVTPPVIHTGMPQFATAEYSHIPGTERCRICGNLVSGEYYRINGQMTCSTCAGQALSGQPADSHAAYLRSLFLGIGAAIVGLAVYAGFYILTGWFIGYLALGVGWFIAKAMLKGSNGLGGRKYQITAVLLTYAAISLSSIPIILNASRKSPVKEIHVRRMPSNPDSPSDASGNSATDAQQEQDSQPETPPTRSAGRADLAAVIGTYALYGIASPFLALQQPFQGALGLFILFIGLRVAWQLTAARRLPVDGPYSVTAG